MDDIKYNAENRLNRAIVLKQVTENPYVFRFAPKFSDDPEIALAGIVREDMFLLVHKTLQNNIDFLKSAIRANPDVFRYFGADMRENYDIALLAVFCANGNYKYLSSAIKAEFRQRSVYAELAKNSGNIIYCLDIADEADNIIELIRAGIEYRCYEGTPSQIVYESIVSRPYVYAYCDRIIREDITVVELALSLSPDMFNYIPNSVFYENTSCIVKWLKSLPDDIWMKLFKEDQRHDACSDVKEIALIFVAHNWRCILHISNKIKYDDEIVDCALSQNCDLASLNRYIDYLKLSPKMIAKYAKKYVMDLKHTLYSLNEKKRIPKTTWFHLIESHFMNIIIMPECILSSDDLRAIMSECRSTTLRFDDLPYWIQESTHAVVVMVEYGLYTIAHFARASNAVRRRHSVVLAMVKQYGADCLEFVAQRRQIFKSKNFARMLMALDARTFLFIPNEIAQEIIRYKKYTLSGADVRFIWARAEI